MTDELDDDGDGYLADIAALMQVIDSGHELVRDGNTVNLTNLELAISDLCQRMAKEPPQAPDAVTAAIQELVAHLSALGAALKAQADNLQ